MVEARHDIAFLAEGTKTKKNKGPYNTIRNVIKCWCCGKAPHINFESSKKK